MRKVETFSGVFLLAGVGLFGLAFLSLAVAPWLLLRHEKPVGGLPAEVPREFRAEFPTLAGYHDALRRGRDLYIGDGCWHCHSQFVRPVGHEDLRYGPVSVPGEYDNELNLPQLFGTRRVGPDLVREAGKHTNDWHFAHFREPRHVVPDSVMPKYPWFFGDDGRPNAKGIAITAYIQWLGAWTHPAMPAAAAGPE